MMIRFLFFLFFFISIGSLQAQDTALPLRRDVFKVKLKFRDRKRKKLKGVLYRLTDSSIVVADSYDRIDFLEDKLRLISYSLNDVRKIKYKSKKLKLANVGVGFGTGFVLGYFLKTTKSSRVEMGLSMGLVGAIGVTILDGYGAVYIRDASISARRLKLLNKHSIYSAPGYHYRKRPIRIGFEADFYNDKARGNQYYFSRLSSFVQDNVSFKGQSYSVGGNVQIPIFRKNNYISVGLKYYDRNLTSILFDTEGSGTLDMKEVSIPLKLWIYSKKLEEFQFLAVVNYEKTIYMNFKENSDFPSVLQRSGVTIPTVIVPSNHLELGIGFQVHVGNKGNIYFLGKVFNNDLTWRFRYLYQGVHLRSTGLEVGYLHNIVRE